MKRLQLLLVWGMLLAFRVAAEQFGSISISSQPMTSGETYHGYREYRILMENQSGKDAHKVSIAYPDRAYSYGNSISKISRTVALAPGARAVVPIWQPPLPQNGSGVMRIYVDDEDLGTMGMPGNSHITRSGSGGMIPSTVLVSRSLNFDDLNNALKLENDAFSAAMATGPNDSGRRRGTVPTAWNPDSSAPGPHWLELDYDPPIKADRLQLYETMGTPPISQVILTGVSGTNFPAITSFPYVPPGPGGRRPRSAVPGSPREISFPLTPEPVKTVRIDFGSTYAGMISVDAVQLEGSGTSGWASSARASSRSTGSSSYPPGMGGPGHEANHLLRSELPASEWSDSWLSFTCFDAVALTANDLRAMPPAVQEALWRYTECGGNLMVFGSGAVPQSWRSARKSSLAGGEILDVGMGRCFVFGSEKPSDLQPITAKAVNDILNASARLWQMLPDEGSANSTFPVVENVRVPVRGIVVIMLAFVITIGPLNIIYLSRKKRRTWLLWTIPAISLVTSLLVFAFSFLREGVTPDVRIEGVTLLDQANRRALSVGTEAFYCPLTPGGGLYYGLETEVSPMVERWSYNRGADREMDWTQGQRLTRGWVTARVPAHFGLRKAETRRERIQIEGSGAAMNAVNGLGAPIRNLWLADAEGKIYSATGIPAGQKAKLAVATDTPKVTDALGARTLAERIGFTPIGDLAARNPASFLVPGSYIAELDTNPFLENGLGARAKSARTRSKAVVFGLLESGVQP